MSKNKKILIVLFLAAILCVLAGIGTYTTIQSQKTTIYMFDSDYNAGTKLSSEMFTPIQVDKRIIQANKSAEINQIFITSKTYDQIIASNDTLRVDVKEGSFLISAYLTNKGGNDIENTMTTNKVAVSIDVNNVTGVTKDITVGSYVNVNLITKDSTNLNKTIANTYEKLRIIAVAKDDVGDLESITIECSYTESQEIIKCCQNGYIHLALVNATGYQTSK